jgi:hypothetical protein
MYLSNTTLFDGSGISSIYYVRYNYMFRCLTMAIFRLYMKCSVSSWLYTVGRWEVRWARDLICALLYLVCLFTPYGYFGFNLLPLPTLLLVLTYISFTLLNCTDKLQ